jgi:hypothetical protein
MGSPDGAVESLVQTTACARKLFRNLSNGELDLQCEPMQWLVLRRYWEDEADGAAGAADEF